ncbi:hypothetical protein Drose_11490 [Dactylosporangium roseum]|uniref:Secreted protein n=1 Tax=Dactylosporangium roseum TaxID=47989 RepID=A0ABY5Z9R8_9ACTN|nr:hypothetical protein [Dactylosporangium roseum]UWZ38786.1 hypothetical protein Drose_11490 [Dactylosporangium roseum]
MREFVQQLPALLGVVVGVVMTYLLTAWGERARWRRERRIRWDADRMQSYVEYGNSVKRVVHVTRRLAVTRGLAGASEGVPLEDGLRELNQANAERTARWESVLLLGDAKTIAAARAWHQSVWQLEFFARGMLDGAEEWSQAYGEYEAARNEYYRCARTSLGVSGGELPAAVWPPPWYSRYSTKVAAELRDAADADSGTTPGNDTALGNYTALGNEAALGNDAALSNAAALGNDAALGDDAAPTAVPISTPAKPFRSAAPAPRNDPKNVIP